MNDRNSKELLSMYPLDSKLRDLRRAVSLAQVAVDEYQAELIKQCDHSIVFECFQSDGFYQCANCGAEQDKSNLSKSPMHMQWTYADMVYKKGTKIFDASWNDLIKRRYEE